MKGVLLPCGLSMLVLGFATLVAGLDRSTGIIGRCGISEENDATLHSCLSGYMQKKREAIDNLKNTAGPKDFSVVKKIIRESLSCFSEDKSEKKICYIKAMFAPMGRSRPGPPKREDDDNDMTASSNYKAFLKTTMMMLHACKMDKSTVPKLYACLKALDPAAQKIIAREKVDPRGAFDRMAVLISSSVKCYYTLTEEQGKCLLHQNEVFQKNLTKQMKQEETAMLQKLKDCGVSKDIIDDFSGCFSPLVPELLKYIFEVYKNPKVADKIFDIGQAMKVCIFKHPEVKKCLKQKPTWGRPGRRPEEWVNPFHFGNVTRKLYKYVMFMSGRIIKDCQMKPSENPSAFICLGKESKAHSGIHSMDDRTAFIALMQLMNSSAHCWDNVTMEKKECMAKIKEEMMNDVSDKAIFYGRIVGGILMSCKATPDMIGCVKPKGEQLEKLARTVFTDPSVAKTVWELGTGLKDCLKADPAVEKCALAEKRPSPKGGNKQWRKKGFKGRPRPDDIGDMMQKHIKQQSIELFGKCKLTPKTSPDVFSCLMKKYKESNMTSEDPKQIFIGGMKLMHTSAICFETASDEQKACLAGKKEEMQKMFSEKSKMIQQMMVKVLEDCGVSESKTPDLVKCSAPKRRQLMELLPDLFKKSDNAELIWDLAVELKKCFESKPDVMKCIKGKKDQYWMGRKGDGKGDGKWKGKGKSYPQKMNIMQKLAIMLKKCGISPVSTPEVSKCMQPLVREVTGLYYRQDMDVDTKIEQLKKLGEKGKKCLENKDDDMRECVKGGAQAFAKDFIEELKKKSSGKPGEKPSAKFDPENAMASMDTMYAGCGITADKTPSLKECLDERTRMVMEIKPWLPMSNEVREKLIEEGKKYWKCFQKKHGKEQKCMMVIVNGFRAQGKPADEPKDEMKEIIVETKAKVLACSQNKCFQTRVEETAKQLKAYLQKMQKKGKSGMKKSESGKFPKDVTKGAVRALLCLRKVPKTERLETFGCLKKIMNETSDMTKKFLKKISKGGPKSGNMPKGRPMDKKWGGSRKEGSQGSEDMPKGRPMDKKWRGSRKESGQGSEDMPKDRSMDNKRRGFGKRGGPSAENMPRGGSRNGRGGAGGKSKGGFRPRMKRDVEENIEQPASPFDMFLNDAKSNDESSITVLQFMFNDQSFGRVNALIGLMKEFISKCAIMAPSADRDIFEGTPEPQKLLAMGDDNCRSMYAEINSFIETGKDNGRPIQMHDQPHHEHHRDSSGVIIAVCTGSVVVGILVLLTIIVIILAKRRCQSHGDRHCRDTAAPTAPPAACPNVYVNHPEKHMSEAQMPPSYSESLDTAKYPTATQILSTSTREEGTEKSC